MFSKSEYRRHEHVTWIEPLKVGDLVWYRRNDDLMGPAVVPGHLSYPTGSLLFSVGPA